MKHYNLIRVFVALFVFVSLASVSYAEKTLSLPNLNGKQVSVSDYKGKWVIVNYWATWCPPCAAEIPELNAFHIKHHKKDAVVLGVNIEKEDLAYVKEFSAEFKISYPVLVADNAVFSPYGNLRALPTTFIIDKQGKLVKTIIGSVTFERLEKIISVK